MSSKNIFLTGGTGFLGSWLKTHLESLGFSVFVSGADIRDFEKLKSELDQKQWHSVIHMAALASYAKFNESKSQTIEINTGGTMVLLEAMKAARKEVPFVFASTGQVYKTPPEEDGFTEDSKVHVGDNIYSNTKLASENLIRQYCEHSGYQSVVLRLFNHSHKSQRPEFFLPSVYCRILEAANKGEKSIRVGNLNVRRDIGLIPDLTKAFAAVLQDLIGNALQPGQWEVFNVSTGYPKNLSTVLKLLSDRLNQNVDFHVDPSLVREGEPEVLFGDCSKLKDATGWTPSCKTEEDLVEGFLADV